MKIYKSNTRLPLSKYMIVLGKILSNFEWHKIERSKNFLQCWVDSSYSFRFGYDESLKSYSVTLYQPGASKEVRKDSPSEVAIRVTQCDEYTGSIEIGTYENYGRNKAIINFCTTTSVIDGSESRVIISPIGTADGNDSFYISNKFYNPDDGIRLFYEAGLIADSYNIKMSPVSEPIKGTVFNKLYDISTSPVKQTIVNIEGKYYRIFDRHAIEGGDTLEVVNVEG